MDFVVRFTDISAGGRVPLGHLVEPGDVFGRVRVIAVAGDPRRPPAAPEIELAAFLFAGPFAIPWQAGMGDFLAAARDELMATV